jgi:phage shock protein A
MLRRSSVVDVFKKELEEARTQIEEEIYNQFIRNIVQELNAMKEQIAYLHQELERYKKESIQNQKMAISSAIEGITRVNLQQLLNSVEQDIINFLSNVKVSLSEDDKIILSNYTKELENLIKQLSIQLSNLNKKLDELHTRLDYISNKIESIPSIDISKIENTIESKLNVISDIKQKVEDTHSLLDNIVDKLSYIYEFNKKLEKKLEEEDESNE